MRRIWFLILWLAGVPLYGTDMQNPFPIPKSLELKVQFWVNVYTRYSIHERVIHDAAKPERIYRVVDLRRCFPDGKATREEKARIIQEEKRKVVSVLKKLAEGGYRLEELSKDELRAYRLFGRSPDRKVFRWAAQRVRVQGGMKEAFKDGIVRSGQYLSAFQEIFRGKGLPDELVYLAHVESSFNPHACSKSGAVGIWQFTRGTGKRYFVITKEMDERRDPILSTEAAAELLKTHYEELESWPLAIMAYHHGLNGIRRAIRKVGSQDLEKIIEGYRSRRFGFASKNFYAEFLAAIRVAQKPSHFFGDVRAAPPLRFRTVEIVVDESVGAIVQRFDVTEEELKRLNPALRPLVFRGEKEIPKGYRLRLPWGDDGSHLFGFHPADDEKFLQESTQGSGVRREKALSIISREIRTWAKTLWLLKDVQNGDRNGEAASSLEVDYAQEEELPSQGVQQENEGIAPLLAVGNLLLEVDGRRIVVQPEETLGHYADWLEIPTWRLRKLNGFRYGRKIRVGQTLCLSFENVSREIFENRRLSYHRGIRETFLESHRIEGSKVHTVRRGETFWTMANKRFGVPLWLLMDYNGVRNPDRITPGEKVSIPIITKAGLGVTE